MGKQDKAKEDIMDPAGYDTEAYEFDGVLGLLY